MSRLKNVVNTMEFKVAATAGTLTLAAFLGGAALINHTDEVATFNDHYTGDGKCLDGTVFDREQGGHIFSEDGLVYVVPKRPNFVDPSILVLSSERHGLHRPKFAPADIPTASYLADQHCPGAEGGL